MTMQESHTGASGRGFSDQGQRAIENYPGSIGYAEQSSDISVKDALKILLDGKWIIAACLVLSIVAAGIFFVFAPIKRQGSLDVLPISLLEANKYDRLNAITEVVDGTPRVVFGISPTLLLQFLLDDLKLRQTFEEAIRQTGAVSEADYDSVAEYAEAVSEEAAGISITPPASAEELANSRSRNLPTNWRIEYVHPNKSIIRDVIMNALQKSEANILENLTNRFNRFVALSEAQNKEAIEDTERAIALRIDEFNREIENRKAVLKEQAGIARVLGIAKNTLESRPVDASGSIVAIPQAGNEPLFMRGYEALEKELAQIDERDNNLNFVPGLVELQTRILQIQQSPLLSRLKAAFAESPLASGEFKAASYQRAWIEVSNPTLRYVIPVVLVLIGGLLGVVLVILRAIMR